MEHGDGEGGDVSGRPRGGECSLHRGGGCDVRLDEGDFVLVHFRAGRWAEVEDADYRGRLAAEEELLYYPSSYETCVGLKGSWLEFWFWWE